MNCIVTNLKQLTDKNTPPNFTVWIYCYIKNKSNQSMKGMCFMENLDHLSISGQLLKVFLEVYNRNSVSTAALELGLNQSSVSYSLDKLRTIFQDPLFLKSGRGIIPTDHAHELIPRVRELLIRMEGLSVFQIYYPQTDTAPLVMAADATQWLPVCIRLYENLSKVAPNAPFKLLEPGSFNNAQMLLETGKANLVVSILPPELNPDLKFLPILSEKQACFYDPNMHGPLKSKEDFFAAHHAVLDFGSARKSIIDNALGKDALLRKIMLSVPNIQTLATLIKGTKLIVTMREGLINSTFSNRARCDVPISLPPVTFNLIWHRRADNSDRNIWFRKMVASAFQGCANSNS